MLNNRFTFLIKIFLITTTGAPYYVTSYVICTPLFDTQMANGWYFLLTEHVGKRKHLHVQERWRPMANGADTSSHSAHALSLSPPTERTSDYSGSICGTLLNVRTGLVNSTNIPRSHNTKRNPIQEIY